MWSGMQSTPVVRKIEGFQKILFGIGKINLAMHMIIVSRFCIIRQVIELSDIQRKLC